MHPGLRDELTSFHSSAWGPAVLFLEACLPLPIPTWHYKKRSLFGLRFGATPSIPYARASIFLLTHASPLVSFLSQVSDTPHT